MRAPVPPAELICGRGALTPRVIKCAYRTSRPDKSPVYFLTACTADRRPVLACAAAFQALQSVGEKSALLDGWPVGRFVLMPDHVHFFARPGTEAKQRGSWIKMWKSVSARRLTRELNLEPPFWQEDTFDHILRRVESYQGKWNFVRENPVRAGLCLRPGDGAWQGEINRLRLE